MGSVSLTGPSGPLEGRVSQRRPLALLALLAVSEGRLLSRDKLVAYFWPETDSARARQLLSVTAHAVRQALGKEAVRSIGDDLRLDPGIVSTDVVEFEQALEDGDLERAVTLFAGPFMDGFHLRGAPDFERWLDGERDRLARRYGRALESLAERAEARGDPRAAIRLWRRLAAHDVFSSRVAVRLMRALDEAGDRPAALQHARMHALLLRDELGAEPDPHLVALVERMERGQLGRDSRGVPEPSGGSFRPEDAPDEGSGRTHRDRASDPPAAEGEPSPSGLEAGDSPPLRRPRRLLPAPAWIALAVGATVALGFLWGVNRGSFDGMPGESAPIAWTRIAVLPFSTWGEDGLAPSGEVLADLLRSGLDGSGGLEVVRAEAGAPNGQAVASTPMAEERRTLAAARESGAGGYVVASAIVTAGRLRVDATIRDAGLEGRVVARVEARGPAEDEEGVLQDLAREVLAELQRGPAARLRRSAVRSTASLSAAKEYLLADRAFRGLDSWDAIDPLRRAVAIDSTFALAHYRLAVVADWLEDWDLSRESIHNALRFGDELPEEVRSLLEAFRFHLDGDADRAEGIYRELVRRDRINIEAWKRLGLTLAFQHPYRGRLLEEAREALEWVLFLDPGNHLALHMLAYWAAREGRYERQDSLSRAALSPEEYARWREGSAIALYTQGTPAAWRQRVEAIGRGPHQVINVFVNWLQWLDDLVPACRFADLLTEPTRPDGWRAVGHARRAELAAASGRWDLARDEIAAAEALDRDRGLDVRLRLMLLPLAEVSPSELDDLRTRLLDQAPADRPRPDPLVPMFLLESRIADQLRTYFLGLVSARLGDEAAAVHHAAELEALHAPAEIARLVPDLARGIRAEIALLENRVVEAVEVLEGMDLTVPRRHYFESPFHVRLRERWLRAEALRLLGRQQEALAWYEGVAYDLLGIHYRAPALLRQAEIFRELGKDEEAAHAEWRAARLLEGCEA